MIDSAEVTQLKVQKLHGLPYEMKGIHMDVLRADLVHPIVSGNKWFKLKYHLREAKEKGYKGLATFGGAYSNHIHATSYAANALSWPSIIVVRGQRPVLLSPTLQDCERFGSTLLFTDRMHYREHEKWTIELSNQYPDYYWIPEGGRSPLGIQGITEMLRDTNLSDYSHICCAAGTGTMMAGLSTVITKDQLLVGIPVLKIDESTDQTLLPFVRSHSKDNRIIMAYGYHEGGYARYTNSLIQFMEHIYSTQGIPLDFVYTAKLFKAIFDMVEKGFFPKDSRLLLIHSGGLQGNRSLPAALLSQPLH